MRKTKALALTVVLVASFGLAVFIATAPAARAVDNPCDPTIGMLRLCKANHGHWDSSCCCCVHH